jgi:D-alanyl-D-alanine dipeptidase
MVPGSRAVLLLIGIMFVCRFTTAQTPVQPLNFIQYLALPDSFHLYPLEHSDKNIKTDIKYATTDNFTRKQIYPFAAVYLTSPALQGLYKAAEYLKKKNLGLIIYDAYRPYAATVSFWEIIQDERYVAHPDKGSRHNRGCAVDVSMYSLETLELCKMPTAYDDFSERAAAYDMICSADAIANRTILQEAMQSGGFQIFETEWWHFDFTAWKNHPVLDVSFSELKINSKP